VNTCDEVEPLVKPHCTEFQNLQTCKVCEENYRLENLATRCVLIPDDQKCKVQVPVNIYDKPAGGVQIDVYDAVDKTDFIYSCDTCQNNYFKI
jgi:hypothetical protein